jgi:MFS transporter, DHA1 family, tetracycline resistance protein
VLLSNVGLGLDYVLMALAPNVMWLLVGRVLAGIISASITAAGAYVAGAYVADVTPAERRAAAFGVIGAAFGIGFVLGPAVGGLLGAVSPRLPFWVAAALSLINAAYGLFVLPESLSARPRSAARASPGAGRIRSVGADVRLLHRHGAELAIAGRVVVVRRVRC